jgi:thiamine biosynthesis lipoprotein
MTYGKFIILPVALFFTLVFSEAGCSDSPGLYKNQFTAMSTVMNISIYAQSAPDWADIQRLVRTGADEYDHRISHSPFYILNHTGSAALPPRPAAVLQTALEIAKASDGAFDPTIEPVLRLWDFDSGGRLPSPQEIAEALPLVDYTKVRITDRGRVSLPAGMGLDLGGIAKGAVVDDLSIFLAGQGYRSYIIDAGGDLLLAGSKPDGTPWRIGIRHPRYADDPAKPEFVCIIPVDTSIKNRAVVTSGDYERFFFKNGKRYFHIIDPHTGYPPSDMVSVTIIADTCAQADALATAAFVLGYEKARDFIEAFPHAEGLFIRDKNNNLEAAMTSGFPASASDLTL